MSADMFEELDAILTFFKSVLKKMICVVNNLGVISVLRDRIQDGLAHFYRALTSRLSDCDCFLAYYQAAVVEMNIYFALKQIENHEDAGAIINKAIITMEKLDRWYKDSNVFGDELILHNKYMMNLIEILYEKKRINIIPPPREVP
jgi:hypothetical protein